MFEDIFLVIACLTSVNEMKAIAPQNARIEETERAAKEMELAGEIQTSILPTSVTVRDRWGSRRDLVWRASASCTSVIPLTGTWLGLDRSSYSEQQHLKLEVGDVMVLYTDGIIEARDGGGKLLGLDAVRASIATKHAEPVDKIRDAIFALTATRVVDDDASVLVFRYAGMAS